jgi:HSP20 family protein
MSTLIRRGAWGRPFAVRTVPARYGSPARYGTFDPFRAFDAQFDALVRSTFSPERSSAFRPAAEVVREGDDAVLRVEIPGVDVEKDITVEVTGRQLTVKGERRDERTSENEGRSLREVRYGSFSRSFSLPEHVDAEAVTATYDAGVLSVRVAGAYETDEPRHIAVTTGSTEQPAGETETAQAEQVETDQAAEQGEQTAA